MTATRAAVSNCKDPRSHRQESVAESLAAGLARKASPLCVL